MRNTLVYLLVLWWGSVVPPELSPDSGLYLIHSGALIFGQRQLAIQQEMLLVMLLGTTERERER